MKKIVMYSGGKDSGATLAIMRKLGIIPDLVVFCEIMFDNERNISGELPEHIEWIYGTAKPLIESWGCKFQVVRAEKDYITIFNERISEKSTHPERIGLRKGFPIANRCVIKRDLKTRPAQRWLRKNIKEPYVQYLGIASDETERLNLGKGCKSILAEENIVEAQAFEIAEKAGLLSPIYDNGTRGGCWFCPNADTCEFGRVKLNHPELWGALLELDKIQDKVSPYFKYNKTLTEVNSDVDRAIACGLVQQMSIWEVMRLNGKIR